MRSPRMELVPARPRLFENDRRCLHKTFDSVPGGLAPALLSNHLLQILAHHLVDRRMALGSDSASCLKKLFLDSKGHIQSSHDLVRLARIPCTSSADRL